MEKPWLTWDGYETGLTDFQKELVYAGKARFEDHTFTMHRVPPYKHEDLTWGFKLIGK